MIKKYHLKYIAVSLFFFLSIIKFHSFHHFIEKMNTEEDIDDDLLNSELHANEVSV